MKRLRAVVAALAAGAIVLVACGGGERPTLTGQKSRGTATLEAPPPGTSYVAQAIVPQVKVYDAPGAPAPSHTLANPWLLNDDPSLKVPLVFLVLHRQSGWVRVLLPERPNGSSGWVQATDVTLTQNRYRILVELGAHRITVYDSTQVFLQEPVAIGDAATPTPTGTYYLRVLLKAPDPTTVYGPYAYGLSGHSEVLTTFNGGDGELGIHGNNDASVLGQSVTHGCVRMSNNGITRLAGLLPLGTPVRIVT